MRLLDVRHEQTAAFAAEATGKLTRVPGLAVLTAGPGVTNGISAIAQAQFAGSPMVVVGGRAPQNRWGTGSLQELDQPPIIAPVAKAAQHPDDRRRRRGRHGRGLHPGPLQPPRPGLRRRADGRVLQLLDRHRRLGRGHPHRARRRRDRRRSPAARRGAAPGADPRHRRVGRPRRGRPRCASSRTSASRPSPTAWAAASSPADTARWSPRPAAPPCPAPTWWSSSAPRSTSASATASSAARTRTRRARSPGSSTSPTPPARSPATPSSPASVAGDLTTVLDGLQAAIERGDKPDWRAWSDQLADQVRAAAERDAQLLTAEADPIHPARIYGELVPRLADDSVVIGDGGDFVSFAGKYVEPKRPGGWLDPGPYGCLGAGLGAAIAARIARPERPGDAAARRRRRRLLADGRRHPRAPRPAGRHGDGQQLRLGPGEGPDADALRLRRGRRPRPAHAVRRRGQGARRCAARP